MAIRVAVIGTAIDQTDRPAEMEQALRQILLVNIVDGLISLLACGAISQQRRESPDARLIRQQAGGLPETREMIEDETALCQPVIIGLRA